MNRNDFKVLIAEDEAGIRILYEKVFKQEGYDVVVVESGSQVLAELSESAYDLLITDLKMEGMSALEFLPEVRKKFNRMPILVVSGYYGHVMEEFHQKGFNVDMFLNKPLGLSELKLAVRRLLGLPHEEEPKKRSLLKS